MSQCESTSCKLKLIKSHANLTYLETEDQLSFQSSFQLLDGSKFKFTAKSWTTNQSSPAPNLTIMINFNFPILKFKENLIEPNKQQKRYIFIRPSNRQICQFAQQCNIELQEENHHQCNNFIGIVVSQCLNMNLDHWEKNMTKNKKLDRIYEIVQGYPSVFDQSIFYYANELDFKYPPRECQKYANNAYKSIEKTHSFVGGDVTPFIGMFYYGLKMYNKQKKPGEDVIETMAKMFKMTPKDIKQHLNQFCTK